MNAMKVKWVDDLSVATAINLRDDLEDIKEVDLVRPLKYHARYETQLKKEAKLLQNHLDDMQQCMSDNLMDTNAKKSKIIWFNSSRVYDFQPELVIQKNLLDVKVKSTSVVLEKNGF